MAEAMVFALGVCSLVYAAIVLALQGAAWGACAILCFSLAIALVVVRLRGRRARPSHVLSWNAESGAFRLADVEGELTLTRVCYGVGWVTLELRSQAPISRVLQLVLWKSAVSAPLWNVLALRVQGACAGGTAIRTRKTHEPA